MSNLGISVLREMMAKIQIEKDESARHLSPLKKPQSEEFSKGFRIKRETSAEESKTTFTHTISVRKVMPVSTMDIRISEFVPKKVIYSRPLKRKSSRRWQKKWQKHGWKKEVEQVMKMGNTMMMSR